MKQLRALITVAAASVLLAAVSLLVYPDVSHLKKENPRKTSFMEYREDEWRRQGKHLKINHLWTPLASISPHLVKAVLIAEDDKFWHHEGFDFASIEKALKKGLEHRRFISGGSTVTQQLAKNLFLTPSKNPLRKLREAVITWRMEQALTKKRILELYLNVAEWGEGVFGIGAASFYYYGKPPSDLTPMEAARLASVLPNPRKYNPTGASRYVENRSRIIYGIMTKRGITEI